HAFLEKEDGTAGVQFDQEPDQPEDGRQDDQSAQRQEEAQPSRGRDLKTRWMEGAGEEETAGRERLEGQLPSQALVGLGGVLDEDPARPQLEKPAERQSPSSLGERDDDPIGPGRLDGATEVLRITHQADDGGS